MGARPDQPGDATVVRGTILSWEASSFSGWCELGRSGNHGALGLQRVGATEKRLAALQASLKRTKSLGCVGGALTAANRYVQNCRSSRLNSSRSSVAPGFGEAPNKDALKFTHGSALQ